MSAAAPEQNLQILAKPLATWTRSSALLERKKTVVRMRADTKQGMRVKLTSRVRSKTRQALQLQTFAHVPCARVHRLLDSLRWDITVLVQCGMESARDVQGVGNARSIRLIRAVRNQRTDDTRRKRLGVDIALQIVKGFVESCVLSTLVASSL